LVVICDQKIILFLKFSYFGFAFYVSVKASKMIQVFLENI